MKRSKLPIFLVIAVSAGLALFWFVRTSRAATETVDYALVEAEGKFEIRDYPALTVATTTMEGEGMNGSFGQLFRFITGSNAGAEKIDMTTPVLIDAGKDRKTMSFIMPRNAVAKGVPTPAGGSVALGKVEAGRFAVLRFEGERTAENEQAAIGKLKAWLVAKKLSGTGDPIFAYYDPPWTPTFLRRNEVMMRIEKTHE